MKYLVLFLALTVGICTTACDENKHNSGSKRHWNTVDATQCYIATGCVIKLLSYGDICDANERLSAGPSVVTTGQHYVYEVTHTSQWFMSEYTEASCHSPFRALVGGIWIDRTQKLCLEYRTQHDVVRQPRQHWVPNDEIDPDADPDDSNTWGHWEYDE